MRDPLLWTTVVSPQQASRRIWDDLLRWKGAGKLSDYTADPSCLEGRPATNGPGCCPTSCSSCSDSNSNLACRPSLINSARSCATVGAPCLRPDPTCQWGTKFNNGSRCCPAGCTQCGGSGCGGAGPNCCVSTRKCGDVAAPCSLIDPECTAGVEGQSAYVPGAPDPVADRVCCDKSCAQCGGPGCGGAGTNCCMGSILSSGVACSGAMAPCVMD